MATTVATEVMRLIRRGDVRAADAKLMIKGGHSVDVPPDGLRDFPLWCKRESWRYAPRGRQQWDPPTSSCVSRLTIFADGGFSAPTVVSTIMPLGKYIWGVRYWKIIN